jgi:hypothetical protein
MMVIFLPWCPLNKEYARKGIKPLPYSTDLDEARA